jgi:hypothetical protein
LNARKDAMQNKIICMASAWQKKRATRFHEAIKPATNGRRACPDWRAVMASDRQAFVDERLKAEKNSA